MAAAAAERDPAAGGEQGHDLAHRAAVGAAQHRIRHIPTGLVEGADGAGEVGVTGQPEGLPGVGEPAVGFVGDGGTEAERPRQGQSDTVEVGHDIAGAAPAVDRLGGVTDHDQLRVPALVAEDFLQGGVGVLGLVEEQERAVQTGSGQRPHLEVVIVAEREHAGAAIAVAGAVGMLEVVPDAAGVVHDDPGEDPVGATVGHPGQVGDVPAADGVVGGVAEVQDGLLRRSALPGRGHPPFTEGQRGVDPENRGEVGARDPGCVQAGLVAVPEGGVGEGMGGHRLHRRGNEAPASVAMDLLNARYRPRAVVVAARARRVEVFPAPAPAWMVRS